MTHDEGKHVMLSYNWDNKVLVSKIHDILVDNGIRVWMDINGGMRDNVNKSMAHGVEKATVVCCFMTPAYQNSYNCQREYEYANEQVKKNRLRIIPCMIGDKDFKKWTPSGSLGIITAGLTYVNFRDDSDSNIRSKARELIDMIKNQTSIPPPESTSAAIKPFDSIRQKYLQQNRIKRMVNEEKSFPIEQNYINLAMVETKEQQEKEKKLKRQDDKNAAPQQRQVDENADSQQWQDGVRGTYEEIYGVKTSIDVTKIFAKCKKPTKKVLVLGRAGIGKSTFCQYVTYRWAKGELWSQPN
ncbi:unnamed protein product [Adineta steineri]|uniref:TIR domain-containing protein n=1 Tax=Adineta steineri TaxID=433720 RepID=A0A819GK83_9BILA|nr:unnamed protein product [Adineta steineri]